MKKSVAQAARKRALEFYDAAAIALTEAERNSIEIADFGLGNLEETGLQLITYINTDRCCAKEMVLFPGQTCPEHIHTPVEEIGYPGKEETFRCRYGTVYLYVSGEPAEHPVCQPPASHKDYYTVWHEVILHPGEQYTIFPGTKHWFQGGANGAVVSEFSTRSFDEYDVFTDPAIVRIPTEEE